MHEEAVILANPDGQTTTIRRGGPPAKKGAGDWNLQLINLKGRTKQFEIGEIGAASQTFLHNDIYWRGWNHYPVQVIPSDGTRVNACDRPSSACPATFHELRHKDGNHIEAMVMYGLTEKQTEALTSLNRSWNFAPEVSDSSGCVFRGYEKRERAFMFERKAERFTFALRASKGRPLENPAFVIANWGSPDHNPSVKINGRAQTRGADYRAGVELDTAGNHVLVIWVPLSANGTSTFEFGNGE
jgi:hypothetical protein